MTKNVVICCDGTGNEIDANLSNVLKLFRLLRKDEEQVVYYNPGVGTIGTSDPWSRFKSNSLGVLGLLTGYGLDANVLDAYRFLLDNYEDGDSVYLFGFSRGAYTVRVLAGVLRLIGLLPRPQRNLCGYALVAYKRAAEANDFEIAWRFERIASTRPVMIKFLGVWDTVSSVIVPRPDRLYIPSLQQLPYTRSNSNVETFRHAISIDEHRRMFRLVTWAEPQKYVPNRFSTAPAKDQDIKQVWFAGVHSDIGGGYPETESGAAKYPLMWMIEEARASGLRVNVAMRNHLVLGHERRGGTRIYTPPSPTASLHDSMSAAWRTLEYLPKPNKYREWPSRNSLGGFYLPLCEPRYINQGALVHASVYERVDMDPRYKPINLPTRDKVVITGTTMGDASAFEA